LSDAYESIIRSRQLVKISIVLIAALILGALLALWGLRLGALRDTEDDNHRLGVVLAEQTTRTFQAVDFVLQELSEKIATAGIHDSAELHAVFGGIDVHDALAKRLVDLPQTGSFAILDADGHYVNQSRYWPNPAFSFTDRAYFKHFVNAPNTAPYIAEPISSRSRGVPTVTLARRLNAPDGTFLGVVFAGVQLSWFDALFAKIGFSDGTGISILRDDGVFLVHFPADIGLSGLTMPAKSPWYETVRLGGGHYTSPGVTDKMGARLVSVHPISIYPIVLDVTRQESAALARWRRQAILICGGVLSVTLGFATLLLVLTRQIAIIEKSQIRIHEQVDTMRTNEVRIAEQSALLETTLEHMNQGLIMADASGIIAVCNKRAIELLGLPAAMMAARPRVTDVIEYQKLRGEFDGISTESLDPGAILNQQMSYERRRPNGTLLEVRSAPLPNGGVVRTYADITARSAAEALLGIAASHDQLTGLVNRNGFGARRDAAVAAARRDGGKLAVLCLDLDRFKTVNDTHGHDAGDKLLVLVSQRMRETARSTDVVARLGGDEFAIILESTDLTCAEQICRRLLDSIRAPYTIDGKIVRIGVSIGVSIYPADANSAEQLLRNADMALYKAKASGRDTWCAYAIEDGQREHARMALELDFRTAVATGQFSLVYQPICEAVTGSPVAFEALVRWNHPTSGVISPAEFIPIAEETGLIIPLGRWIIETACAEAATWAVPMRIAVNLSPAQFRESELVLFIREVLSRTGLSPARLELEVTEGLLLDDADNVVKTMQELRAMGIRMILDDFGTAHSNLSYLRGFPFEAVKIDRSFVSTLSTDRQARALVEAILAMARALGLEVVGEGVESQEQLAMLRQLQCRFVQGYLLGRPAAAQETRDRIWKLAASQVGVTNPGPVQRPAVNA
jgi:diguanylate cyclase (GGDEF)-like protein/PAS domain S-box-containing protein